jgi:hypothetical protein
MGEAGRASAVAVSFLKFQRTASALISTPFPEEVAQQFSRFLFPYPAEDVRSVMTCGLGEDPRAVNHAAAFGIFRSEPDRVDAGNGSRRRAHRAGLKVHPQGAAVEPRLPQRFGCAAHRNHFGVRSGIERTAHRISGLGNDFTAPGDDRAHRHLVSCGSFSGKIEGPAHGRREWEAHFWSISLPG